MRIDSSAHDDAVLEEVGTRIEHARLQRNWTQAYLAQEAGIGLRTLSRLEGGHGATLANVVRVLRVLDLLDGLERAIPEAAPSPIQELRRAGRVRRRASGPRDAGTGESGEWRWGDEADS